MMKEHSSIDAAAVLRVVSEASAAFDATRTAEERQTWNVRDTDGAMPAPVYSTSERDEALSDFETLAAADALIALAEEIEADCQRREQELYLACLEAYYTAEELSRDPQQAHLLPHVEAMRKAHETQYGKEIPPQKSN